jgi:hypothetical protein
MSNLGIETLISDYRERLPAADREQFDERLEEEISNLDLEEISDELRSEYEQSEEHLELVAAVASGFHQTPLAGGYDSGYEFAFTEPLEEQNSEFVGDEGVKNGDVLLVKNDDENLYLCVVECKSGTHSGREWITELGEIESILSEQRYRDIIKSQIGAPDSEIRHIQYAIVGKISQVVSVNFGQIQSEMDVPPHYALWGYDLGAQSLVHVHGEVRDSDLAGTVNGSIDTGRVSNPIEFTLSDHPLTQLKVMIERIITSKQQSGDSNPFEFTRLEFKNSFENELSVGFTGEVREELVNSRVEYLLGLGRAIDIFTDSDNRLDSDRDYRILFRGDRSSYAKSTAENKYFDWSARQRRKKRAFEDVRDEFETLPQQADLGQYGISGADEE